MDIFCPIRVSSLGCKIYAFVIVDYYTRFTLILFIAYKDEALEAFLKFYKRIQNEKKSCLISKIKSNHGEESENFAFEIFVKKMILSMNFKL